MGDGYAVLLGNHGPITVGKTLEHALERAVTLEEAARTYSIARTIGTPVSLVTKNRRVLHLIITITVTGKRNHRRLVMLEFNESLIAFDLHAAQDAREVIDILAGKMHAQGLVSGHMVLRPGSVK
jgi:hypothetical protein